MRTERRRGRSAALLVAATLLDVASSTGAAMAADAGGTAAGRDRAALTTAIASLVVAVVAALFAMARDRRAQKVEQSLASQQEKLHRDLAAQAKASQRELEMLKAQLTASAKAEERALDAKTQLDRHREPLLLAVLDLTHRIDNIRNQGFLGYLRHKDGHRADVARLGTFYRFARYWAVAQWLYEEVNLLPFERESETRAVAEALGRVGSLFASDTGQRPPNGLAEGAASHRRVYARRANRPASSDSRHSLRGTMRILPSGSCPSTPTSVPS